MFFGARCLITLLFGYLCMTVVTAVFTFQQNTWGESYYILNGGSVQNLLDQRGRVVLSTQLAEHGLEIQNGKLLHAGKEVASYTDNQVTIFRPVQTGYFQQKNNVRLIALISALVVMVLVWQREVPGRIMQRLSSGLPWLRPLDIAAIGGLGGGCLLKTGVIDQVAFENVVHGLHFGLNYYVHDTIVGTAGRLTIFPYNPLSLLWMHSLAVIDGDFQLLGLHLRGYALFSLSIFAAYVWLCLELATALRVRWKGSTRVLFLLLLLNPFGIYYTVFLGQIDVIPLALFVAGSRRLLQSGTIFPSVVLILLGLVFAKPQHALMLPALAIALFAARGHALKVRVLLVAAVATLACLIVYWFYGRVPAFVQSLATNPQAARIGWATWFQLFGDAVVINRPLAFMIIAFLVLAYRVGAVADAYGVWEVMILSLAVLTACFQASYAHTFGLSILMYPAIMLMVCESEDLWRGAGLWVSSILLLVGWGTGAVGDASQVLGLALFTPERVQSLKVAGMNYPSLLATVETAAYITFGLLLLLHLLDIQDRAEPVEA